MTDRLSNAEIGLIGLAVMGQNLALNFSDHGFKIAIFNRTVSKVTDFYNSLKYTNNIVPTNSIKQFINSLKSPKRIVLMVKAGKPVDSFIQLLIPLLNKGDIIIDGGNSNYNDTMRRYSELMGLGLYFIGCGISGGEIGARYGPSMMPGGSSDAWDHIKPLFQCISAKVDNVPCCDFVGGGGSGHYVKMVHNGIEYGDMQVIAEVYAILKDVAGLSNDELSKTFEEWNKSELDSYLIEITANIFKFRDPDGKHLIDKIRDAAGQKGTGKWSGIDALNDGVPLTLIVESVFARCLSSLKNERVKASAILVGPPTKKFTGDVKELIECTRQALYAAKIISYTQGFMTMRAASDNYKWDLNMGAIASMWRGGCIIRSTFLGNIKNAFDNKPKLQNLLFDDFFKTAIVNAQEGWRKTVVIATQFGIPVPCLSSALSFYDGYRSKWVPANLTQAQRDYFGSHTYELLSNPGNFVHTNWTGYDQ